MWELWNGFDERTIRDGIFFSMNVVEHLKHLP